MDTDGIPLSERHKASIQVGIWDFYALDFEGRCLNSDGTYEPFNIALGQDFPGYQFEYSEGKYTRYNGVSSFSDGEFSETRTGDWSIRNVDWYFSHSGNFYKIGVRVHTESCDAVAYDTGILYNPREWWAEDDVRKYGEPCPFQPLQAGELGRRGDIAKRPPLGPYVIMEFGLCEK